MNNIINFNKAKERLEEKRKPEESDVPDITSKEYIEEVSIMIVYDIMNVMEEIGYDLTKNPKVFKDIVTIAESIKSTMYRMSDKEYFFQRVVESVVQIEDDRLEELIDEFVNNMVDIYEE